MREYPLPLSKREPTSKLILETKVGKVEYATIDEIVFFLLNNTVDYFSVSRNGQDITNIVTSLLEYRR